MVRGFHTFAMLLVGVGLVSAAAQARRAPLPSLTILEEPSRRDPDDIAFVAPDASASAERGAPFLGLFPLHIANVNTRRSVDLCLYDLHGRVDHGAAEVLDQLLGDARDPHHVETTELDRRTLQILYRAAYHFRAKRVDVISAYRKAGAKSEGQHGTGRAIDFKLKNVGAPALAAYLRGQARVGVGVYTHPKTQYVHLDVRERSYYWLDASPPGRTWRERQLVQSGMAARDAGYARANDWPEGTVAPPF